MDVDKSNFAAHDLASKIIDKWLETFLYENEVSGMVVSIARGDEIIYNRAFGSADSDKNINLEVSHNFRVASMTKSFTAVAVLQLVEKGKLALEDKIVKHLDWFVSEKDAAMAEITVSDLLSHTAGLRREGGGFMWDTGKFPTAAELRDSIKDAVLVSKPQDIFKYSNLGFAILGQLIEKVADQSYEKYISENIFTPLQMGNSFIDKFEAPIDTGYDRKFAGSKRREFAHYQTDSFSPAAGLVSNTADLTKFLAVLHPDSGQLLTRRTKKLMQRVQFFRKGETLHYGYGLMVDNSIAGLTLIKHDGAFIGFKSQFGFDPESKIGVVVLANCNDAPTSKIFKQIYKTIQAVADKQEEFNIKNSGGYAPYEGKFTGEFTGQFVVVGDRLIYLEPMTENTADFLVLKPHPDKPHTFIDPTEEGFYAPGEEIQFHFKENGEVDYVDYGGYKLIPHQEYLAHI